MYGTLQKLENIMKCVFMWQMGLYVRFLFTDTYTQRGNTNLLLPIQRTTNHSTWATAFSMPGCHTNIDCGPQTNLKVGINFLRTFMTSASETLVEDVCEQENNRLLSSNGKVLAFIGFQFRHYLKMSILNLKV